MDALVLNIGNLARHCLQQQGRLLKERVLLVLIFGLIEAQIVLDALTLHEATSPGYRRSVTCCLCFFGATRARRRHGEYQCSSL